MSRREAFKIMWDLSSGRFYIQYTLKLKLKMLYISVGPRIRPPGAVVLSLRPPLTLGLVEKRDLAQGIGRILFRNWWSSSEIWNRTGRWRRWRWNWKRWRWTTRWTKSLPHRLIWKRRVRRGFPFAGRTHRATRKSCSSVTYFVVALCGCAWTKNVNKVSYYIWPHNMTLGPIGRLGQSHQHH